MTDWACGLCTCGTESECSTADSQPTHSQNTSHFDFKLGPLVSRFHEQPSHSSCSLHSGVHLIRVAGLSKESALESLNLITRKCGKSPTKGHQDCWTLSLLLKSGMEKQPKPKVFGRDTPRASGRISGQTSLPRTFTPWLGAQENKVFCADVLDPKARTSMTRGGHRKTLCRKTSGWFSVLY